MYTDLVLVPDFSGDGRAAESAMQRSARELHLLLLVALMTLMAPNTGSAVPADMGPLLPFPSLALGVGCTLCTSP